MPTKRTRRTRRRRERIVPEWARRLLEHGEEPARGTAAEDQYIGWLFFGEPVPGLPEPEKVKLPGSAA